MKTASIGDLRKSFARISRWLESGESVEVTRRGRVFAHIVPATCAKAKRAPKPEFLVRLRADFDDFGVSDDTCNELLREAGASQIEPAFLHEFSSSPQSHTDQSGAL